MRSRSPCRFSKKVLSYDSGRWFTLGKLVKRFLVTCSSTASVRTACQLRWAGSGFTRKGLRSGKRKGSRLSSSVFTPNEGAISLACRSTNCCRKRLPPVKRKRKRRRALDTLYAHRKKDSRKIEAEAIEEQVKRLTSGSHAVGPASRCRAQSARFSR
jgi:hypothetical protein